MGSFDVGCGISSLAIHTDDKIGFVILGQNDFMKKHHDPMVGRASYTYTTDTYQPFIAPIFGRYNDSGEIMGISPSVTTKVLESIFSRPIDDVIQCIASNQSVYAQYGAIYKNYVRKSVVSALDSSEVIATMSLYKIKEFLEEFNPADDKPTIDNIEEYYFGEYLFKRELTAEDRSWTVYPRNPDDAPIKQEKDESINSFLDKFSRLTGLYPGINVDDYKKVRLLESLSGMYFLKKVYEEMISFYETERGFFHAYDEKQFHLGMTNLSEAINYGNHKTPYDLYDTLGERMQNFFKRETCFPIEYIEKLDAYSSKEFKRLDGQHVQTTRLVGMFHLSLVMHFVNKTFQPSYCGGQNGDDEASLALQKISSKILRKRFAAEDHY